MDPVKTVLKPIKKGLELLTQRINDMQKLLNNLEKALSTEKAKTRTKAKTKPARKSAARKKPLKGSATDAVLSTIKGSVRGVTSAQIKEETGFNDTKIRNIIFRLKKQGRIKNRGRGVYVSA
jgi:predicted Rossmann fold nucleotide-binding protein DprA/Smf involved in DNA uptake